LTTKPNCGGIPPGVYQGTAISFGQWLNHGGLVWVRLGEKTVRLVNSENITLDGGNLTVDLTVNHQPKARR